MKFCSICKQSLFRYFLWILFLILQVENEYSNMESQYSVSVIIPVHNTAPYLRRCIESVRNQTLKDIEIILVDNLSTDDSPSICDDNANIVLE